MDAKTYFQSHENYFWQWEEGGEVIAIPKGATICYREQLITILTAMSHKGLPPLGSVLMVIAAMGPQPEQMYAQMDRCFVGAEVNNNAHALGMNHEAKAVLRLAEALPASYKTGLKKIETLRALFEGSHNSLNTIKASNLIDEFRKIRYNDEVYVAKTSNNQQKVDDLRVLALLHQKFKTVDDLKKKIAGLPTEIKEDLLELEKEETPEAPKYNDFVDELMDKQQTFPIGSLVRRIWSGLNIPFHNQLPSEQPMGGVSDLTNKGDFHRLLTSEFANDDIILLSRLANNEALYINREVPPQSNKKERVILLDVSIRNWGTPKTIAYALLLAIARHPKTDIPCSAYVVGDEYKKIEFGNIDDIISSMHELDGCLHPGNGMKKFFDDNRRNRNMELIFITNPDTIKIPGLSVALQEFISLFKFWLIADQEGNVDVYKNQKNSKKHSQHFRLPLDELWKNPPKKKKFKTEEREPLNVDYPILFPGNPHERRVLVAPDGVTFAIGNDRNVYRITITESGPLNVKGWMLVYESLKYAFAKTAIGQNDAGQYIMLSHSPEHKVCCMTNLSTGKKEEFPFAPDYWSQYPEFFFYNGMFYLFSRKQTNCISLIGEVGTVTSSESNNQGIPMEYYNAYREAEAVKTKKIQRFPWPETFLKNINSFGVTAEGELIMNKHVLKLQTSGHITWKSNWSPKIVKTATAVMSDFYFNDNCVIRTTRSGMLLLELLNEKLQVYVPTALDRSIGIATDTEFCGNTFYQHDGLQNQSVMHITAFWQKNIRKFIEAAQAS